MSLFKTKKWFFCAILFFATAALAVPPGWPEDGIIVEPDMGRAPLISAFKDAKHSLKIAAYSLTDDELIAGLSDAVERGVKVEILVTNSIFKREKNYLTTEEMETPLNKLEKIGAIIKPSPDFYIQAHNKLIIIDGSYALIGTGNMNKDSFDGNASYKRVRDFWTTVTDINHLKELKEVFTADFTGEKTDLKNALLVWSPDQGRTPFLNLFDSAKKSIWVYQQSLEDKEIANGLAMAAKRGIDVRLMMTPYPFTKTEDENLPNQEMIRQAGGKVGLVTHLYAHAKLILVDVGTSSPKLWLGSTNFYSPSLENNRELGIIISSPSAIDKIGSVFNDDWVQADFNPRK